MRGIHSFPCSPFSTTCNGKETGLFSWLVLRQNFKFFSSNYMVSCDYMCEVAAEDDGRGVSRRAGCRGNGFGQMQRTGETLLRPLCFVRPSSRSRFVSLLCLPVVFFFGQCFVVRACLRSGGFSSKGAFDQVSGASGTFTLKAANWHRRSTRLDMTG